MAQIKVDLPYPLKMAIRTVHVFGIVLLVMAGLAAADFSTLSPSQRTEAVILAIAAILYGACGLAYLILSVFLGRNRRWAVAACVVLTTLLLLLSAVGLANYVMQGMASEDYSVLQAVIIAIFTGGFAYLEWRLISALNAMNRSATVPELAIDPPRTTVGPPPLPISDRM